jgi:hypothetical protein
MTVRFFVAAVIASIAFVSVLQFSQTYRECRRYGFDRAFCATVVLR